MNIGHDSGGGDADHDLGSLATGTRIGANYRVQRVLGHGSMGVVYLARDVVLERDVAIKVLAPHYAADERVAKRFRREAVAMASVRSENVVQIFAFGDHNNRPYFVMEYIPGYTVGSLIENASSRAEYLYLDVVIGILKFVCRGLQAVHDAGIVHRDVKPANMLVGPGFRVALADFGLVEVLESAPGRDLAGTPLYLAPEIICRQELADDQRHLSDIYALGISTYEMLTGDVPFSGKTIKEILRRHINQPPKPVSDTRSDLPTAVDDVLRRALHKIPQERHASCGEFLDELTAARERHSATSMRSGSQRILLASGNSIDMQINSAALKVGFPQALVMTADDGLAAFEMATSRRPDLFVVDLDLKGMNGLELCASLIGNELTADVPVVVIAANYEADTRQVLRSLGLRDLLQKPVDVTNLVNIARQHLGGEL